MFIRIDHSLGEPLYMQIRAQIIGGIARGELQPGDSLPSVRRLASDLGINLHTVNKAYAVLRDEGYIEMRGRSGAFVARANEAAQPTDASNRRMLGDLYGLAVAYRARGGTLDGFLERATAQAKKAFGDAGVGGGGKPDKNDGR